MEEKEYEQDLAIDPHSLDEDWLHQPGLFMKYSVLAADAQKKRDQVKDLLAVVEADLDRAIRKTPDKYGIDKFSEKAVVSAILTQPEHKTASDDLIQANYELNILQSAVRALDHKRSALENEVKLWLGSYFSGPKEPRDIPGGKRIIDIARDNVSFRMREEMNKRDSERRGVDDQESKKTGEIVRGELGEKPADQPRRRRGV